MTPEDWAWCLRQARRWAYRYFPQGQIAEDIASAAMLLMVESGIAERPKSMQYQTVNGIRDVLGREGQKNAEMLYFQQLTIAEWNASLEFAQAYRSSPLRDELVERIVTTPWMKREARIALLLDLLWGFNDVEIGKLFGISSKSVGTLKREAFGENNRKWKLK